MERAIPKCRKEAFDSYIQRTKKDIESSLLELCSTLSGFKLQKRVQDAILSPGKRLRPTLVILAGEAVDGERKKMIPLSLSYELVHTATLVHDDIIDQDEIRRDRPSLYKKWSVNDAILTGDTLIALAVEIASGYGEVVLKNVARSALELCEGEFLDYAFDLEEVNEESYFRAISQKSASLFKSAAYCGGLVGDGDDLEINALSKFGENFGMAYQLKDDLLNLSSCSPLPSDIMNVRLTFPLVMLLNANNKYGIFKEDFESLRKRQNVDSGVIKKILMALKEEHITDRCDEKINEYVKNAIECIEPLEDNEFKSYLVQLARTLLAKDSL
jgi:geranylgeranyl diphosphate synthase type I